MKLLRNFWNKYLEQTEQLSWYYYAAALIFWLLFAYLALFPFSVSADRSVFFYDTNDNSTPFTAGGGNSTSTLTVDGYLLEISIGASSGNARAGIDLNLSYSSQIYGSISVDYDVLARADGVNACYFQFHSGATPPGSSSGSLVYLSSVASGLTSTWSDVNALNGLNLVLGSINNTACSVSVLVKKIYSATLPDVVFYSATPITPPSELNVTESIIQMPDVMNVQTDSLNYALGFMIFLMSVTAWYTIIRRK